MRATGSVLREVLRARLWVVPSLAALLAALAALGLVRVDLATDSLGLGLAIGPDSARALLSTIAGAMISFTALVFTITMLVLQSASTQLSPRVVRTFLRDRFNQAVLGLFVATFVYSLLVLAAVGESDVPQVSVISAVGLVLVAVLAFVSYIDHMAHDIRPSSVIESIAAEAHAVIERVYPEMHEGEVILTAQHAQAEHADGRSLQWSGSAGYVQSFDLDRLLALAEAHGADVELHVGTGEFLVHGQPLLSVMTQLTGATPDTDVEALVRLGPERTMSEDPAFGLRLLVDVALRALSPSLNDPSTAIQAIDRLHELLSLLQVRRIPSPLVRQTDSGASVVMPTPDWDAYVRLATSELGLACQALPQVRRHLQDMIGALLREADPARQPALRRAQTEIDAARAAESVT